MELPTLEQIAFYTEVRFISMNYCGQHGLTHHKLSWTWNKLFTFSKEKISII